MFVVASPVIIIASFAEYTHDAYKVYYRASAQQGLDLFLAF